MKRFGILLVLVALGVLGSPSARAQEKKAQGKVIDDPERRALLRALDSSLDIRNFLNPMTFSEFMGVLKDELARGGTKMSIVVDAKAFEAGLGIAGAPTQHNRKCVRDSRGQPGHGSCRTSSRSVTRSCGPQGAWSNNSARETRSALASVRRFRMDRLRSPRSTDPTNVRWS
jgi:hypothetical protein